MTRKEINDKKHSNTLEIERLKNELYYNCNICKEMKATIEKINGKWTVNGKPHSEMSMLEIGLLNEFFIDFNLTTNQRCKKFCNCKINELLVDCEIVEPTKVFDEKFDNPIDQIDNFLNNDN